MAGFLEKLYMGVRMFNIAMIILMFALFIWSLAQSKQYELDAYRLGRVALGDDIRNNNEASVRLFSIVPIVAVAMLLITLFMVKV